MLFCCFFLISNVSNFVIAWTWYCNNVCVYNVRVTTKELKLNGMRKKKTKKKERNQKEVEWTTEGRRYRKKEIKKIKEELYSTWTIPKKKKFQISHIWFRFLNDHYRHRHHHRLSIHHYRAESRLHKFLASYIDVRFFAFLCRTMSLKKKFNFFSIYFFH